MKSHKVLRAWLQLMKEDDNSWPMPDRVGRQELEVVMGSEHISFTTTKLGSLLQVWPSLPLGPIATAVKVFSVLRYQVGGDHGSIP